MKFKTLLAARWTPKRVLFAVASCTYLLLATLPVSRWLVRWQSTPGFPGITASGHWREQNLAEAAKHPDDFALQFAATLQAKDNGKHDTGRRLWALRNRFPNEPSLYAAVLRYLTLQEIHTGRVEEQDVLSSRLARAKNAGERAKHPTGNKDPESAKLLLASAQAGERIDPQNAFFPMMESMALFATHQDTDALQALHRASQMPHWNDYVSTEAFAGDALIGAAHGETGTLAQIERYASILFPHMAELRAVSRVATGLAVRKELAGDLNGGWAVRNDVAHVGAVMRADSSTYIGSLVGVAISQVAMSRPGGEELPEPLVASMRANEREQWCSVHFLAYAKKIGRGDDAAFFVAQKADRDEIQAIYNGAEKSSLFSMRRLSSIVGLWCVGSALVANAAVVLLFGGIAFGLSRTPRLRAAQTLHPGIRWAFAVLAVPIPCAIIGQSYGDTDTALAGLMTGLITTAIGAVFVLGRGTEGRRNIRIFAVSLPAILAGLAAMGIGTSSALQMLPAFQSLTGMLYFDASLETADTFLLLLGIGVANLIPLLWISTLAARSLFRKVPVSVGIVRGTARGAMTVAALLLFAYSATVLVTLRIETQAMGELTEITRHEGHYLARLTGRTWPELKNVR